MNVIGMKIVTWPLDYRFIYYCRLTLTFEDHLRVFNIL